MKCLTRKDELLLLSILKLGDDAYLVKLREYLNKNTNTKWSIGNVFVSLERLEGLGYIESKIGESSGKRGGKAIKFYFVRPEGFMALKEIKIIQENMWAGLQELIFNR